MAKKPHLFVSTSVLLLRLGDRFWPVWTGTVLLNFLWLKVCFIPFFLSSDLSLVWRLTVFLGGLMLFYVLSGVEQCYLFVLCIAKWTVWFLGRWLSFKVVGVFQVDIQEAAASCSVSRNYLSVLVKTTCLAAFQNKHLVFEVGRLVFVGPTLCKIRARIYGVWLSLIYHQKILLGLWDISKLWQLFSILADIVRNVCSTCPEGSLECLPECWLSHLTFIAAEEWHSGRSRLETFLLVRYNSQQRIWALDDELKHVLKWLFQDWIT